MKSIFTAAGLLTFCVQASVLSNTAAQMQAGTWAEVTQANIGAVMGGGAHTGNLAPYAMSAAWDTTAHRLHFLGEDHGCTNSDSRHVYYDEASNAWTNLGPVTISNSCHGYDHITLDQAHRILYLLPPTYSQPPKVLRFDLKTNGPWADMGTSNATGYNQVSQGVTWFEGPLTGIGSAGALLHYNCGQPNGEIALYDPNSNQWAPSTIKGFGGATTYHGMAEYSRVHNCAVMGGGNNNPKKLWRLNADKSVTAMPDAPVDLGIQRGNVLADPVTGNFLVMGYGQLWELNPAGNGKWTQQTGSRVPPSAVGNPGNPDLTSVISVAVPNHGVEMYITCRAANCNMYLYKHAGGSMRAETRIGRSRGSVLNQPSVIYDIRGRAVARFPAGKPVSRAGLSAGIYLVRAGFGRSATVRWIAAN